MKKKSIIGLIVLMGFSLLGIILVQFLWMNNAIQVQNEKFTATVYDALNASIRRVEKEQAANFFMQQFLSNQIPSQQPLSNNNRNTIPYFPQPKLNNENILDHITDGENKDLSNSGGGTFEAHFEIQSNGEPQQVTIKKENIDFNNKDDVQAMEQAISLMEDSIKRVLGNNGNMDALNMFNQFSYELQMRSVNPLQRLNTKNLNNVLDYELNARGIDLDYEYGIINRNTGKLTNIYTGNYYKDDSDFKFVANLFPNDIFRSWSPIALDIYFPHQGQFILKSLGVLFGSSIVFTLFILLTFLYTLRTIVNQKKLSEIKSDFINNMTHEFKTPIATINLATDNIANPMIINKPEHISSFLKIIKEENKRMNNQVERVLQMSLIEKRDFQLLPVEKDIHQLINDATQKMQLLAEQKSAVISSHLNAESTVFNVDEVHFTNVLVNLLENALKYSKENPVIDIITENNKNGIDILIRDNGIGMSKEQQAKVFEKFFRATKGNIHNVKGFGLGLSYVKAIMLQHGGNIFVKSKLGEGSEFKLFLPFK
ncbi:sensor histidine kinase [Plebeiibacterium sediminum]|uniref:histidine kinase n=1 Tax=Plebeiibacterium sediminum TaxID=2992112 RepID=A0AAE3SGA7_9BACT|nr:HAMP domain-containing sensor histidine kinase [Plebeiobacterium sediminum]MCW3788310.1 HAMP domain-containing histidine kinase [Plebeiobacterium sediminum]